MRYLDDLNSAQRAAVQHTDGPLLVLAGAGSGKTRVITYKIVYLLDQLGADASQILAVTFTNKVAEEMRQRVARLLGSGFSSGPPWIGTFHGFCAHLLRRHIESLGQGYTSDFSIYDEEDQLRLLRTCFRERGLDEQRLSPRVVHALISRAKSRGCLPADLRDDPEWTATPERALALSLFEHYQQRLCVANALDFDDLLLKAVALLQEDVRLRARYRERFRFILVDEYQDTNRLQLELLRLLAARETAPDGVPPEPHLCVVGDPDQSIYRWRGADPHNILEFERHFPNSRVITLDRNYRSTKTILAVANALIHHNTRRREKKLWTENEDGPPVGLFAAETAEEEATFVLERIHAHLERDPHVRIAVLYRTNAQSRLFEEACRRAGVPFRLVGGFSFYKRTEVRDVLAYVQLALNPWDDESLRRILNVPPRGIGKKTLDALERLARAAQLPLWEALRVAVIERRLPERIQENVRAFVQLVERLRARAHEGTIAEVFRFALFETGYLQALRERALSHLSTQDPDVESRLLNLEELLNAAVEADERGERLREFVDRTALVSEADDYDPNAPVTLMTMHSAKGLEFPIVFIVGLEDGLFPHARSHEDQEELEEERRLFYVAITRAERYLYLTYAHTRRRQGQLAPTAPSRFLRELPHDLLQDLLDVSGDLLITRELHFADAPTRIERGTSERNQLGCQEWHRMSPSPFHAGARVRHPIYGIGHILKREESGAHITVTVLFLGLGRRKFIEGVAPLELLS